MLGNEPNTPFQLQSSHEICNNSTNASKIQNSFSCTAYVRMKKAKNGYAVRQLKAQHRVYYSGRSPMEGSPARELELTATYRVGIDIGEWKSLRKVTGQENPQWPSDPPEIMT
jgi:hypothetical protein